MAHALAPGAALAYIEVPDNLLVMYDRTWSAARPAHRTPHRAPGRARARMGKRYAADIRSSNRARRTNHRRSTNRIRSRDCSRLRRNDLS